MIPDQKLLTAGNDVITVSGKPFAAVDRSLIQPLPTLDGGGGAQQPVSLEEEIEHILTIIGKN